MDPQLPTVLTWASGSLRRRLSSVLPKGPTEWESPIKRMDLASAVLAREKQHRINIRNNLFIANSFGFLKIDGDSIEPAPLGNGPVVDRFSVPEPEHGLRSG